MHEASTSGYCSRDESGLFDLCAGPPVHRSCIPTVSHETVDVQYGVEPVSDSSSYRPNKRAGRHFSPV